MKAVIIERFGGPEVMEYRDVPTPEVGPDDVLIEVHAVTVNRALDIHVRESGDGRNPVLPLVLGVDPVGVIAAVGTNVPQSRLGERVAVLSPLRCGNCIPCKNGIPADCIMPTHLGIGRWGGYAEYVPSCRPWWSDPALPCTVPQPVKELAEHSGVRQEKSPRQHRQRNLS